MLRLAKIAKVLRFLKIFKQLWLLVAGIMSSLRLLFWVLFLLGMMVYMGSLFCVMLLKDKTPEQSLIDRYDKWEIIQDYLGASDMYWGSVPRAMLTLFNLVLMFEDPEFLRPIFFLEPVVWFVLVVFSFFTVFGVLNVLMAVIVENTLENTENMKKEEEVFDAERKLTSLLKLRNLFTSMDEDKSGTLSVEELTEALTSDDVYKALEDMNLPVSLTGKELFMMLNSEGTAEIDITQFMKNAVRLIESSQNPFEWQALSLIHMNRIMAQVARLTELVAEKEKIAPESNYQGVEETAPEFVSADDGASDLHAEIAQRVAEEIQKPHPSPWGPPPPHLGTPTEALAPPSSGGDPFLNTPAAPDHGSGSGPTAPSPEQVAFCVSDELLWLPLLPVGVRVAPGGAGGKIALPTDAAFQAATDMTFRLVSNGPQSPRTAPKSQSPARASLLAPADKDEAEAFVAGVRGPAACRGQLVCGTPTGPSSNNCASPRAITSPLPPPHWHWHTRGLPSTVLHLQPGTREAC
jgi:hypothetical protein